MKKIYLAGPWFTKAQAEREERLKKRLRELGFEVHSPKEDSNITGTFADPAVRQATFDSNISHIDDVDIVFAIMDGKRAVCNEEDTNGRVINAIDTGTLFEVGYAYCLRKKNGKVPVIVYYTETTPEGGFNLMLAQSCDILINKYEDLDKLPDWIENNTKVGYNGLIE